MGEQLLGGFAAVGGRRIRYGLRGGRLIVRAANRSSRDRRCGAAGEAVGAQVVVDFAVSCQIPDVVMLVGHTGSAAPVMVVVAQKVVDFVEEAPGDLSYAEGGGCERVDVDAPDLVDSEALHLVGEGDRAGEQH